MPIKSIYYRKIKKISQLRDFFMVIKKLKPFGIIGIFHKRIRHRNLLGPKDKNNVIYSSFLIKKRNLPKKYSRKLVIIQVLKTHN